MWTKFLNEQIGLLGAVATLVFGIISIIFYYKSRRIKKPTFIFGSTLLQTTAHPKVTILFENEKIENLSKLNLLFWNAGKEEIRAVDIPSAGGPSVEFVNGARILSYTVKDKSSDDINFSIAQETSSLLRLDFEYLNPGDGAVIEVLYDYANDEKTPPIQLKAPIIGASPAVVMKYQKRTPVLDVIWNGTMGIAGFALGVWIILSPKEAFSDVILSIVLGSLVCIVALAISSANVYAYFKCRIPNFSESYFE
jgi:hypothetical protein